MDVLKENMVFKNWEEFKVVFFQFIGEKVINWSCVKIVKHLWKSLFSEGWALWAKLDTGQIDVYVCGYPTIPAKKSQL